MTKQIVLAIAMALSFGATTLVAIPSVIAKKKQDKGKAQKAKRANKSKQEAAAVAEDAAAAAEKAEERTSPAQFTWTGRPAAKGDDMDSRADAARDEAIAKLLPLMSSMPEGPSKAELVFRLSEMFWAKSKFKHLSAMRQWDQALEKWSAKRQGPEPKVEDVPDMAEADVFKRKALQLYEQILEKYPDYPRKDEVLYNLGSSYYESGDKRKGVEMYWKLIKQFPESGFTPDAWLQLGEHFFNANKLTQAMKAYTNARDQNKARIYSYALYKLAWCDYNLQEYDKALAKFREVIAYAKKQKEKQGAADIDDKDRIQLQEEALSDMIRAYSHLDAIDEAVDFYWGELGKEKSYKLLRKLAMLYNVEGKHALEIKMYQRLNSEPAYMYKPEAPENQVAIMNAYAQLNRSDNVRQEVRTLIDLYSPNALWAQKNAGNKEVLEKAFDQVEQHLAALVTEKHREAQSTKLADTYKLARDIYKDYLDKFNETVNAYKFRFFYAEILMDLKEFENAAREYDKVVAINSKGEFVKHAAYASILAWEKVVSGVKEEVGKKIEESKGVKSKGHLKELEKIKELEKGKKYDREELKDSEQMLANACDQFVNVAPNDEEVVKVKFKSARLYYIHNQFKEASERFGEIIDRWPEDKLGRFAAESILQSWNVREDWTELNKWSRKFRENNKLMGEKDFAKKTIEFVEGASFNEIHFVYEPKGEPLDIADRYAQFVKEFPKSKYVMVGLYNSIVNYDKSNFLERAISYAGMTLEEYKDFKVSDEDVKESEKEGSKLPDVEDIREKVLFLMAGFQERLAQFDLAADYYEQYIKSYPNGPNRSNALFNAAVLREGLGEFDSAIKSFSTYASEFKKKKDVPEITWRIGLIYEKKKDYKAMQSHFASFAKAAEKGSARQVCADFKVVQSYLNQNKAKEASAGYDSIIAAYNKLSDQEKKDPCALEAVAAGAFSKVDPAYNEYMALTLAGPEKDMAKKLMRKLEMVDELQKQFTAVLQIGQGDYGIASLYRVGNVYQDLAKQIFATPCPKRLDMDQCMIYESELQSRAFPLEEKAIEAFDKALAKAYELGLYNDWLAKAQASLREYEPGRFPEIHTYELIASEKVFEVPALVEAQP
ncbi:MAG: hypothetical protein A2341_11280 [Deltaproteobacteria bacterium RIFOXYB12_FULL_58_9]|nr:MAG: hypothetical protein A2341_11280 [Deltaproteobacteria bacterium RIFOXYB12_FULL_58_9]